MTTIRQRRLRTRCKYEEEGIVIHLGIMAPLLLLERWQILIIIYGIICLIVRHYKKHTH